MEVEKERAKAKLFVTLSCQDLYFSKKIILLFYVFVSYLLVRHIQICICVFTALMIKIMKVHPDRGGNRWRYQQTDSTSSKRGNWLMGVLTATVRPAAGPGHTTVPLK